MHTIILNGSPRPRGDTAVLLDVLKAHLPGQVTEIRAYDQTIRPCIDCRYCWTHAGCVFHDAMEPLYGDDFDAVVIASPIYVSTLPGPLMSIASRFQASYAAQRFQRARLATKPKASALLLTGGGDGSPDPAMALAQWMFRWMCAPLVPDRIVTSLHTDTLPAAQDTAALQAVAQVAQTLCHPR